MERNWYRVFWLLMISSLLTGCIGNKKLTYLQEEGGETKDYYGAKPTDYLIQENDIISIRIRSLDTESNDLFNTLSESQRINGVNGGDLMFYLNGYTVDNAGDIEIPVLGKIKVAGSDIETVEARVREGLKSYFNDVFVSVQLSGIRFSVVGDISRPGKYLIYQDQATIFEALALAGDAQFTANRKEVQIIRSGPNGVSINEIDLTDQNVIESPYFFIHPNDIINVKPLKVKSYGIGTTGFNSIALSLSAIANVLLIISYFNNI
ncbi:polysaccharide biosynthesis/export family protein [Cryomorphaceae bacterium]|nr:polysaccharide biosynthesis/export family protein [Cryomorphaceae bacterium]